MATKTMQNNLTITTHATQQDAVLLMQIMNGPLGLRAADGLTLLWDYERPPTYEQFVKQHPSGSQGQRDVQALLTVNETIATFVKQGLIDRGLVYDLLWVKGVWDRCANIALHYRKQTGEPEIYANFERLAAGQT